MENKIKFSIFKRNNMFFKTFKEKHKNTQLRNTTKIIAKVFKDTKVKQLKIIGNNNHYKVNMHLEVRMPIEINTKPTRD